MNAITTHVLDTATGRPAAGVPVTLEVLEQSGGWARVSTGVTGPDGRLAGLVPDGREILAGVHRLRFDTGAWFAGRGQPGFYPEVTIVFEVTDPAEHHHVPLLLSPYGYTTYRGS
jgi:5-hydroxyisourate hydrolase